MAITTIGSYVPTMQEFINHWNAVDATLPGDTLALRGGYTILDFTAARAAIQTAINTVIAADNTAATTAGNLAVQKEAIRERLLQFRKWVAGYLEGTGYFRALPNTPSVTNVESRFVDPLEDMRNLWGMIDTDVSPSDAPVPIVLAGGYDLADFTADLTALRASYVTAKNAAEAASLARKQRDVLLKPAEQRMKQYRTVIQGLYAADNPFVTSLPALNPPPGSTPDAVELTGAWDAVSGKAALEWTASEEANLDYYSVRVCIGTSYKVSNEFSVAEVPSDTTTLETLEGLPVPGAKAVYRVYVVVTTGNEKGSNNVFIERPVSS
jgi:hypothetical protein